MTSQTRRTAKKSPRDALYKSLFAGGLVVAGLVGFGWATFSRSGASGLGAYALTVLVAFAVGFLALVFIPRGSRWAQLPFWGWLVTNLVVMWAHMHLGAWFFGYGAGLLVASALVNRRHARSTKQMYGDRVLMLGGKRRRGDAGLEQLTQAAFRKRLSELDGNAFPTFTAQREGSQLCVFGDAAGRLVVYFTADPRDDLAWRRLATPELASGPTGAAAGAGSDVVAGPGAGAGADADADVEIDAEVEVPLGGIAGTYRARSTVGVDLARQAGDYFVRTGDMDPSLEWESGEDVFNRLPPIRLVPGG